MVGGKIIQKSFQFPTKFGSDSYYKMGKQCKNVTFYGIISMFKVNQDQLFLSVILTTCTIAKVKFEWYRSSGGSIMIRDLVRVCPCDKSNTEGSN